jgi:hypothetical protein
MIVAVLLLAISAVHVASGQEDPKCTCAFAYHCDLGGGMGPEDPGNVLYTRVVDIGSCSGLECEGYCRTLVR